MSKFTDQFFGCKRNPSFKQDVVFSDTQVIDYDFYQLWPFYILPSTSQWNLGMCVSIASCSALEAKMRRDLGPSVIPAPYQLDPRIPYKLAREKYFPDEKWDKGGLFMTQVYEVMRDDLGWIPPDVEFKYAKTAEGCLEYERDFPAIIGVAITEGWKASNVSKRTGQIDESYNPQLSLSGHAVMLATWLQQHNLLYAITANLGWMNWGKDLQGIGLMTYDFLRQSLLDDMLFLSMPNNWETFMIDALANKPEMLTTETGVELPHHL